MNNEFTKTSCTFVEMEFWKKKGRKAFAKHLRNKKSKWTKRMANSKSRQDALKEVHKQVCTPSDLKDLASAQNKFDVNEWTW